ncbi:hypothetical protein B0F90DRAFT_385062 [Multifurca ochricompacta]|uniref:Uncharacterized protein n=1 Tax=Multifurca ochricompacta TaxID=376703 RepID=A0AAD4LXA1_9AGAM|nr:hypothetical protein B0F90DRAFT_385062 [Multifurca ochricompacta]
MQGASFKFHLISYIILSFLRPAARPFPTINFLIFFTLYRLFHILTVACTLPALHHLQDLVLTLLVSFHLTKFTIYGFLLLYHSFQNLDSEQVYKGIYTACSRANNQKSSFYLSLSLFVCKRTVIEQGARSIGTIGTVISNIQHDPTLIDFIASRGLSSLLFSGYCSPCSSGNRLCFALTADRLRTTSFSTAHCTPKRG